MEIELLNFAGDSRGSAPMPFFDTVSPAMAKKETHVLFRPGLE